LLTTTAGCVASHHRAAAGALLPQPAASAMFSRHNRWLWVCRVRHVRVEHLGPRARLWQATTGWAARALRPGRPKFFAAKFPTRVRATAGCGSARIGASGRGVFFHRADTRVSDTLGLRSQVPIFWGGCWGLKIGAAIWPFADRVLLFSRSNGRQATNEYMWRKKHDRTPGCRTPSVSGPRSRLLEGGGCVSKSGPPFGLLHAVY
jgi:hypothetical protein